MTLDEHIAAFHELMRIDHEEKVASRRAMLERFEATGESATTRQLRGYIARLGESEKPWEKKPAPTQ